MEMRLWPKWWLFAAPDSGRQPKIRQKKTLGGRRELCFLTAKLAAIGSPCRRTNDVAEFIFEHSALVSSRSLQAIPAVKEQPGNYAAIHLG